MTSPNRRGGVGIFVHNSNRSRDVFDDFSSNDGVEYTKFNYFYNLCLTSDMNIDLLIDNSFIESISVFDFVVFMNEPTIFRQIAL